MTAALASDTSWNDKRLREYDARRDMVALADLIETAFGERLDETGRRMIREMRFLGQAGWLGWLLGRWLLPPAAHPHGFVWEEDGRLVGNASLLPVTNFRQRWVIANVAVLPAHRRKGIAGNLVDAGIQFARKNGARTLILQVDAENEHAISLYRRRGFEITTTRTVWIAASTLHGLMPGESGSARRRMRMEWREQWDLAQRLHPEGLIWPYPSVPALFRPTGTDGWFGRASRRHWVRFEQHRLVGSLSLRASGQPGIWRLVMVVEPELRGLIEVELLAAALTGFQISEGTFVMEYPSGAAEQQLQQIGFRTRRTLTWMQRSVDR